ncbi:hypothetical protein QTP88_016843 [Uroleucon formosanum]
MGMSFQLQHILIEQQSCFAKLNSTDSNDNEIEIFNEHNHKPLPENILTRQKISNNFKRKVVDDMFIRPSKILHSELKNDDIEVITSGDVLLIKRNIHNARYSKLPKLPTTLTQILETFKNMEFQTIKFEDFFRRMTNKHDMQFNPVRMYVDFEKTIHIAANVVWPIQVKGCRFHLGQSWHRKIQQLGLSTDYKKKNPEISNFLKLFFGIPFLNAQDVENCFTEDIMAIQPQDARVLEFTDYILDSYIKNDAEFSPEILAKYLSSILRMTNNCESFHRKLNS